MAKNPKDNSTKVTRIKATDAKPAVTVAKAAKPATVKQPKQPDKQVWIIRAIKAIGAYFKGAWVELRAVRWPNRRATWGLTGAVLAFTAFFVVVILLLDALFKELFSLILK